MTDIRHIVVPMDSNDLFAAAEFESTVSVWSFARRTRVAELRTILDAGGPRFALDGSGEFVIAAAHSGGVEAYHVRSGSAVWRRKERGVKHVIELSKKHRLIGIGQDTGAFIIVDLITGKTELELEGVSNIFPGPASLSLGIRGHQVCLYDSWNRRVWERPTGSFAVLDVAFSATQLLISEAAGGIHCLNLSGKEHWRFAFGKASHALHLKWSTKKQLWLAVVWNYEQGGPKHLYGFDDAGQPRFVTEISDSADAGFIEGEYLIESNGDITRVEDHELVWNF